MKIQVFSDIHFEAYQNPNLIWRFVTPQAPVAVVAGDIDAHKFEKTVTEIATRFEKVICVLGNHEYYRKDIAWKPDITQMPDNVVLLDPGVHQHEDILFIGATLWTDFKDQDWFVMHNAKDNINDFRVVKDGEHRFTPHKALDFHHREKAFIKLMIEENRDKKVVIVTHFMPTYHVVHEKWKKTGTDNLNYYFAAQCDDLINMCEAKAWIFGHTHDRRDMMLGDVRMVCNPLGYARENPDYQDMIIEV